MMSRDPQVEFVIMVRDEHGDLRALTDIDGRNFATEAAARRHLEAAAAEYPSSEPYVAPVHIVNFEGDSGSATTDIAPCPPDLPEDVQTSLRRAAQLWRDSDHRPRVAELLLSRWCQLIEEWIDAADVPLLVRKHRGTRGQVLLHASGRAIIPVDNTPAHWALGLALAGHCPDLNSVRRLIQNDAVPIAMTMTADERRLAKHTGRNARWAGRLNDLGWKVCHATEIGLRSRTPLADLPIESLTQHFRSLMSPANMFLVPLVWAGFGELPEVRELLSGDLDPTRRD